jgi:hypothetical protein
MKAVLAVLALALVGCERQPTPGDVVEHKVDGERLVVVGGTEQCRKDFAAEMDAYEWTAAVESGRIEREDYVPQVRDTLTETQRERLSRLLQDAVEGFRRPTSEELSAERVRRPVWQSASDTECVRLRSTSIHGELSARRDYFVDLERFRAEWE